MQNQNQNQNPYPNYGANGNFNANGNAENRPVSVGEWLLTFILMIIPIVRVILLFVWAFGGNTSKSKANWAKATLIMYLIGIAFAVLILLCFWGAIAALVATSSNGW